MMAMARKYLRATHQTAALVVFQTGQPRLVVFGIRLGVFAGLRLSAVSPGEALNWDRMLVLPDDGSNSDQDPDGP